MACAVHSHPALVVIAYWNGVVVVPTAGATCFAMVRPTDFLITFLLAKASRTSTLLLENRDSAQIHDGSTCHSEEVIRIRTCIQKRLGCCMPEDPPVARRRAYRRICDKRSSSNWTRTFWPEIDQPKTHRFPRSGWEFSLGLSTDRTLPSETLQQWFSPDRATSEIGFVGETFVFLANDSSNFRDTSDIILDPENHQIVAQVRLDIMRNNKGSHFQPHYCNTHSRVLKEQQKTGHITRRNVT